MNRIAIVLLWVRSAAGCSDGGEAGGAGSGDGGGVPDPTGTDATTNGIGPPVLPAITGFSDAPSDTFIVSEDAMEILSMATPFAGSRSECAHTGAHVQFLDREDPYRVDVFAPADGQVTLVEPCLDMGANDRYGLSLAIARSEDQLVVFDFALEPMGGHLCATDPRFYEQFLFVEQGEWVAEGDKIAELLQPTATDGATHIHFDLRLDGTDGFFCPNIFSEGVDQLFFDSRNGDECGGQWSEPGFCWLPDPGQDLVHGP